MSSGVEQREPSASIPFSLPDAQPMRQVVSELQERIESLRAWYERRAKEDAEQAQRSAEKLGRERDRLQRRHERLLAVKKASQTKLRVLRGLREEQRLTQQRLTATEKELAAYRADLDTERDRVAAQQADVQTQRQQLTELRNHLEQWRRQLEQDRKAHEEQRQALAARWEVLIGSEEDAKLQHQRLDARARDLEQAEQDLKLERELIASDRAHLDRTRDHLTARRAALGLRLTPSVKDAEQHDDANRSFPLSVPQSDAVDAYPDDDAAHDNDQRAAA
jgi:chromosome segregation ATPase